MNPPKLWRGLLAGGLLVLGLGGPLVNCGRAQAPPLADDHPAAPCGPAHCPGDACPGGCPGHHGLRHAVQHPCPEVAALCEALSPECRGHVHVFFVNGFDLFGSANLYGLCEYVQSLGFAHCYYGQMFNGHGFHNKIRCIRASDPAARIVLVGFSGGAYVARSLTHSLGAECIHVDLLVYLGGDALKNTPYSRPDNALHVLNVMGDGWFFSGGNLIANGTDLDGAHNLRLDARHMLLPTRQETVAALTQELAAVAGVQPLGTEPPAAAPAAPAAAPANPAAAPAPKAKTTPASRQKRKAHPQPQQARAKNAGHRNHLVPVAYQARGGSGSLADVLSGLADTFFAVEPRPAAEAGSEEPAPPAVRPPGHPAHYNGGPLPPR